MSICVNKVTLFGYVGNDPDVRSTKNGSKIVSFRIATSDIWTDRQSGEQCKRTEWHRIVVYNENLAGLAERLIKKGRKVYVEGALRRHKWEDQNGLERQSIDIVLDQFHGDIVMGDSNKEDVVKKNDADSVSPDDIVMGDSNKEDVVKKNDADSVNPGSDSDGACAF